MLLYPALFLLINKLHIFKSHPLSSVCQFYKLEKISGQRGVVAAGAVCRAGQPYGGFRLSRQVGGHPTGYSTSLLLPHTCSSCPEPLRGPRHEGTSAQRCDVLWDWAAAGADDLDQCGLLNSDFFCWAVSGALKSCSPGTHHLKSQRLGRAPPLHPQLPCSIILTLFKC